jgi:hypothetical protein
MIATIEQVGGEIPLNPNPSPTCYTDQPNEAGRALRFRQSHLNGLHARFRVKNGVSLATTKSTRQSYKSMCVAPSTMNSSFGPCAFV